jgi:hypothetical protein
MSKPKNHKQVPETITFNFPWQTSDEIAKESELNSPESLNSYLDKAQISILQQVLNPIFQQIHDRGFTLSQTLIALEQSLTLHWTNLQTGYDIQTLEKIAMMIWDASQLARKDETALRDRMKESEAPVIIVNARNESEARVFWDNQNEVIESVLLGSDEFTQQKVEFEVWINGVKFAQVGERLAKSAF